MPSAFVAKVAQKAGVALATVEAIWKETKEQVKSQGKSESDPLFFGLVTKIFKRRVNKRLGLSLADSTEIMESFLKIKGIILE